VQEISVKKLRILPETINCCPVPDIRGVRRTEKIINLMGE
jgi:hypothetical protein